MTHMTATPSMFQKPQNRLPSNDLPETPDDIDLDRIVTDPEYRRAVQDLLRRWGIGDDRNRQTVEKRSRVAGLP